MEFMPDSQEAQKVPFFKDTMGESKKGWAGHTTRKSIDKLQTEIKVAISLLGGTVTGFMKGTYAGENPRDGYHLHYVMESPDGLVKGKMEVAALPVKKPRWMDGREGDTYKRQREQSLKMALYMLRDSIKGMWYLQQLSPGFAALMPFMIVNEAGDTVTQLWSKQKSFSNLLPPGDSKFETEVLDGDFEEVN